MKDNRSQQRRNRFDEDDQDATTDLPQGTRMSATKRSQQLTDETQKELRALPLVTISPPATSSSSQMLDPTPNPLLRSLTQAKTTGKGVDTLENVSFPFQKGHRMKCTGHARLMFKMSFLRRAVRNRNSGHVLTPEWFCLTTHIVRLRDITDAMERSTHINEGKTIIQNYLQSTRVVWSVVEDL